VKKQTDLMVVVYLPKKMKIREVLEMGVVLALWQRVERSMELRVLYPEIEQSVVECAADPSKGQYNI